MIGPGKYDLVTEHVRKVTGAEGVLVIVLGGDRGSGFSMAVPGYALDKIPGVLREVASQIEQDAIELALKNQTQVAAGN